MFEAERIERLRLKTLTANYCLDEIKYRFFKAHGKGEITYDSYAEAYEKAFDYLRNSSEKKLKVMFKNE